MLVLVLSVLSGDCLNAENRRENDLDSPETKEVEVEEEEVVGEVEEEVGGEEEVDGEVGSVEVVLSGVFLVPVAVRVFVLVLLVANKLVVLTLLSVLVVLVLWSMVSSTRATITPHLADRALPNSISK